MKSLSLLALTVLLFGCVIPAHATFHLTQIEQVIGGVNTDTTAQAIQLRARAAGQNFVSEARLVAYDAAGSNAVLVLDLTTDVTHAALGDRVLVVSPNFVSHTTPATVPDFFMTTPIPESYLAAGKLAWEDDLGNILWSVSWGGTNYTGSNAGSSLNDDNGDFGPAFDGSLPSDGTNALVFAGGAAAQSTSNNVDYTITTNDAVFVNNAGTSFTLGTVSVPANAHDLSVVSLKVPKTINHRSSGPAVTKKVVVQIQNRSVTALTITNLDGLVTLDVQSLGLACSNLTATLVEGGSNKVPRTLKPNGKLSVTFTVTFDCANDPLKGAGHEDYQYVATVHHEAADSNPDSNTPNDVCPRDPNPNTGDPGCGGKNPDHTLGAEVLTDVIVK